MSELSNANATDALRERRLKHTECARPSGYLVGMEGGGAKAEGHLSDMFRDERGRHFIRLVRVSDGKTTWLHVTVEDASASPSRETPTP